MKIEILFVTKNNSALKPYDAILSIGGKNFNGTYWRLNQDRAIAGIMSNKWNFYVTYRNMKIDVVLADVDGRQYIKAKNDDLMPNILLSLPESI